MAEWKIGTSWKQAQPIAFRHRNQSLCSGNLILGNHYPFLFYFYTYDSRYCLMSTETQRKHVQYRHSQKQIQQQECSFSSSFTSGKLLTMDLNCVLLIFLMFLYKCKCRQQLWVAPLISRDSMKISSLHDAVVNQEG